MSFFENYTTNWSEDSIRIINTPSVMARQSFFYVQETGFFKTESGYYTEREHLPSYLILYTVSGAGRLEMGDKVFKVEPGSVLFINCMEHHAYYPVRSDSWQFYWVHFYGATSDGYYQCYRLGASPILNKLSDSAVPDILSRILEVNRVYRQQNELLNSKLLVELLTEVISKSAVIYNLSDTPPRISEIIGYMERHFDESVTLDRLADRFFVSKYHLSREFKKYTGNSPGEYLIQFRMSRAKELLKQNRLPVSLIAEQVGIPNESHFSALFKSREECSPGQYRRLWRNKE